MKPPTKFELMRKNRWAAFERVVAEEHGLKLMTCREALPDLKATNPEIVAETSAAAPTMEVDGVKYREAPEVYDCDGCAFQHVRDCQPAQGVATAAFGSQCGNRNVIYIRAE